jgi:hypothetical protein
MHKRDDIPIDIQKQVLVDTKFCVEHWHRDWATFRGIWVAMKVLGKSLIASQNKDIKSFSSLTVPVQILCFYKITGCA